MSEKTMFVPPAKALSIVGLVPGDVGDNEAVFRLIDAKDAEIRRSDSQISVLIYILHMRGLEEAPLVKRTGYDSSTIYRKIAEGMAIVRTGNVDRATAAVRTGALSKGVVDSLTKGKGSASDRLSALEQAALGSYIKSRFVTEDGGAAPDVQNLDSLLSDLSAKAEADSVPLILSEFVDYLPTVTEALGIKRKSRTPGGSESGPYGLEYHFNAAMDDVRQLQKDSDGEPYVPTPADLDALLRLANLVGIDLSSPMFASQS